MFCTLRVVGECPEFLAFSLLLASLSLLESLLLLAKLLLLLFLYAGSNVAGLLAIAGVFLAVGFLRVIHL
jgi:hypothetical protein